MIILDRTDLDTFTNEEKVEYCEAKIKVLSLEARKENALLGWFFESRTREFKDGTNFLERANANIVHDISVTFNRLNELKGDLIMWENKLKNKVWENE